MPGEFVPRGYLTWLRTWIDDDRYIGPVLWSLDYAPIKLTDMPNCSFDSAEEKQRVGELLNQYNQLSEEPGLFTDEPKSPGQAAPDDESNQSEESDKGESGDNK